MEQLTYENIKPLVDDVAETGSSLAVTFRCPLSQQTARAQVAMADGGSSSAMTKTGGGTGSAVGRGIVGMVIRMLISTVLRRFGIRGFGRRMISRQVGRSATRSALDKLGGGSSGDRNQAVVRAFRQVRGEFVWDETRRQWVHKTVG